MKCYNHKHCYNQMRTESGAYVSIDEVVLVVNEGLLSKPAQELAILRDFSVHNAKVEDENGITRWVDRGLVMPIE